MENIKKKLATLKQEKEDALEKCEKTEAKVKEEQERADAVRMCVCVCVCVYVDVHVGVCGHDTYEHNCVNCL